ncbi:Hypothetical protein PACV_417 [Pacmanvirus A23]|uniref:Hypothetical protein n=1 Tax=Pacmanvirus A23 TaxID=1932881 RepID=UPI000A092A0A|nr:Hypothetical protein B9W72_gp413 [Pacmanvirus A23]SIP86130.1 Hypothetical protein PACV_417 [Pacmanvirus A23]
MVKEIVFLFIVLVILFFALYSTGGINPQLTTENLNIKPAISDLKNTKLGPKKHVSFADMRHERIFNKVTGSIIGEQYNEL